MTHSAVFFTLCALITAVISLKHEEFLNDILLKQNSDVRPHAEGEPVTVSVTSYISQVEWQQDRMTTVLYLRQTWNDNRLVHSGNDFTYGASVLKEIWRPDTFVPNSCSYEPYDNEALVRISPNGDVLVSERIKIVTFCSAPGDDLARLSNLSCVIEFESYGHSEDQIKYAWLEKTNKAVTFATDLLYPINHIEANVKSIQLSTGNYGRLNIELFLDITRSRAYSHCMNHCISK